MGLFNDNEKSYATKRRGSLQGLTADSHNLQFNSFAGTDIQCFLFDVEGPAKKLREAAASDNLTTEQYEEIKSKLVDDFGIQPFGEIQTITVSIANQPGPIRRLGEREVVEYKMGARTVAGSMIFAVLNRDIFANYMKGKLTGSNPSEWRSPNYIDELPEFNILIQGGNEFGAFASGMLIGVRLTNFGTTFSVDDLFTEATYNYVARHYIPFTDDWKSSLYDTLIGNTRIVPLSQSAVDNTVPVTINGHVHEISRVIYEWWKSLPPVAMDRYRNQLPQLQDKLLVRPTVRRTQWKDA